MNFDVGYRIDIVILKASALRNVGEEMEAVISCVSMNLAVRFEISMPNSMKRVASKFLSCSKNLPSLTEPGVSLLCSQEPSLVPVLSYSNLIHTITSISFQIYFNIIQSRTVA
jgi:hypothetical protein